MDKSSKGFLMGAATAAHQVEGNNKNSDFWAMEQMEDSGFAEPSLEAVDHYNCFREDIDLMAKAGLNAYRFSIEWARIEPQKGYFDESETEHYKQILQYCWEKGVEPVVTLHHFSSPNWLIAEGGWEDERVVFSFVEYCRYVITKLGDLMHYVCTINEANMGLQLAAIAERYKNQIFAELEKSGGGENVQTGINVKEMLQSRMKAQELKNEKVFGVKKANTFLSMRTDSGDQLIMRAHQAAREVIKAIRPELKIGITLSLHDIQALPGGKNMAEKEWEKEYLHYLPYLQEDDFLGVQNYTRIVYDGNGQKKAPEDAQLTQMGYEYFPQALAHVIRSVCKEWKMPVMITENGIATENDGIRGNFIREALSGVAECMEEGIPVLGYFYWSLMDNFEWQMGFSKQFGLIAVERTTQRRYPKKSLYALGSINQEEFNLRQKTADIPETPTVG